MTVKLVSYEHKRSLATGLWRWKRINLTGRWKLESGALESTFSHRGMGYVNRMFIEHKGLFFRRWIPEDRIEFLPEKTSKVFSCTKERPFKGLPRA